MLPSTPRISQLPGTKPFLFPAEEKAGDGLSLNHRDRERDTKSKSTVTECSESIFQPSQDKKLNFKIFKFRLGGPVSKLKLNYYCPNKRKAKNIQLDIESEVRLASA